MVAAPRGAVTAALLLVFECLRLSIVARAEIEGMSPFLQLLCCLLFSTGLAACRCSLLLSTVLDTVLLFLCCACHCCVLFAAVQLYTVQPPVLWKPPARLPLISSGLKLRGWLEVMH